MGLDVEESIVRACSVLSVSCPCAFRTGGPPSPPSPDMIAPFQRRPLQKAATLSRKSGKSRPPSSTRRARFPPENGSPEGRRRQDLSPSSRPWRNIPPILSPCPFVSYLKDVPAEKEADIHEIPGQGLVSNGFFLGNAKSAEGKNATTKSPLSNRTAQIRRSSISPMQKKVLLAFSLHDELVPDSVETIARLKEGRHRKLYADRGQERIRLCHRTFPRHPGEKRAL